jgi:hypothetical protein
MAIRTYESLEPSFSQSLGLGKGVSFSTDAPVSLFTTTSFLYSLAIMISVVAAGFIYARAGLWRMQASEAGVRKSNEEIKRATLGLLGVLSLFVILYTFNRGLLSGEVGFKDLRVGGYTSGGGGDFGGAGATGEIPRSTGTSVSCESPQATISKLTAPGGICGGTQCTILSGCNYQKYLPTIKQEASRVGVDYKLVIAIMCRESRASPIAQRKNTDGTFDCGLMQVNQKTACDASALEPSSNIARGAELLKRSVRSANQLYQNIPVEAGIAATYNCCSNGTVPNATSVDCTAQAGFPFPIPKWACPINPGEGKFNMCFVKGYSCEVSACLKQLTAEQDL